MNSKMHSLNAAFLSMMDQQFETNGGTAQFNPQGGQFKRIDVFGIKSNFCNSNCVTFNKNKYSLRPVVSQPEFNLARVVKGSKTMLGRLPADSIGRPKWSRRREKLEKEDRSKIVCLDESSIKRRWWVKLVDV